MRPAGEACSAGEKKLEIKPRSNKMKRQTEKQPQPLPVPVAGCPRGGRAAAGGADPPPPPPQTHPQIQQGPYPAGSLRREVFAESRWRNGGEARWDGAGGGGDAPVGGWAVPGWGEPGENCAQVLGSFSAKRNQMNSSKGSP